MGGDGGGCGGRDGGPRGAAVLGLAGGVLLNGCCKELGLSLLEKQLLLRWRQGQLHKQTQTGRETREEIEGESVCVSKIDKRGHVRVYQRFNLWLKPYYF